jgi:hypothetical protein
MGKLAISLVSISFAFAPASAADDAIAIIDKSIKAYGGAEALDKTKIMQWRSKGTAHAMGVKIAYTADYSWQMPNKMRFDMDATFMDQKIAISAGSDGKTYWEKSMDTVRDMEKKKADAFRHQVYTMSLSLLVPLKGKEYTLSASGEEKIEGKPALGVLVSHKGTPDVMLYFDKESHLIVKQQTQIWDEFTDKDVNQEVFFSDYKDKDGTKIFAKMVIKRDGKIFVEEEFSDQKVTDKLDAKLFEKP